MSGDILSPRLDQIGELSSRDRELLASVKATLRSVKRGEDVKTFGDRPQESVIVVDGLLQRYTLSAQGSRQIHSLYIATDMPCLETLYLPKMDASLGALAPSTIALVPHRELHRVMGESPNLLGLFWRETLVQAAVFRAWLVRNSQLLAHAQMAHFFCEMLLRAEAAGCSDGREVPLPLTQQDIADALGMTAVHANRTLMLLRSAGMAEFRSGILTILDRGELMKVAEFDDSYLHLCGTGKMNEPAATATG